MKYVLFDISEMDNEKCDASEMDNRWLMFLKWWQNGLCHKGCCEVSKSSYNTLTWSKGYWFWVITLLISQILFSYSPRFSNPSKLLYINKLVELNILCNFLAMPIIIWKLLKIFPNVTKFCIHSCYRLMVCIRKSISSTPDP